MEPIQRSTIVESASVITESLSLTEVLVKLYSRRRLTQIDLDTINHPNLIPHQRRNMLLTILQDKEDSYYDLLEILIATNQSWIAKSINEKYKELGGEKPIDVKATKDVLDRLGWKQEALAVRYEINYVPRTVKTTKNDEADSSNTNVQQSSAPAVAHAQRNHPETADDED